MPADIPPPFNPAATPRPPQSAAQLAAASGSGMAGSREMRDWIASLEAQNQSIKRRNVFLLVALTAGLLLLLVILWLVYNATVRSYAVLEDVEVFRHPENQGNIQLKFHVATPGKVLCTRVCGGVKKTLAYDYEETGDQTVSWADEYEPGQEIEISLLYRGGLWRTTVEESFPTSKSADIVVLMDTTGSMDRSIATLKDKCVAFSQALKQKQLDHRFCLLAFGDARVGEQPVIEPFTPDAAKFKAAIDGIQRFDGGDLPESSLDALEEALKLPFAEGAVRRFYLVTDTDFHNPAQSGATAEQIAERLKDGEVLLNVFTRADHIPLYEKLTGRSGKVAEIEDFGQVLSGERILED